jgi:hypothetical protein
MSERRFSEDEVALILRKATDTGTSLVPGADSDGLTLDQLKGIGREVGIPDGSIEAAARQVALRRSQDEEGLMGVSATPRYETVLPAELSPARLSDAVAAVRRATGRQGIVRTEFGGLEWQARDALGGRYVSLQPSEGKTHVRVFGNFRDAGWLSIGMGGVPVGAVAAAVGAGIMKTAGLAAFVGVGALPAGILAGAISARFVWKRLVRRETRALERAAAELAWALAGDGDAEDGEKQEDAKDDDPTRVGEAAG